MRALLVCALAGIAGAQQPGLGKIEFVTAAPAAAQKHFLSGVLYLHSFEYDDAREEFLLAQRLAPGFVMAYWGEAMTYNEPLWDAQNRGAARAVLGRLGQKREGAIPREREYLQAVEILYGEGSKEERDRAYAAFLGTLAGKYPNDLEIQTFYALALLGTCHAGREAAVYEKAAGMLEKVVVRNPQHPGALHYLIHCYDDPLHARRGLGAARLYAKVAPEAAHALHMPSHIYFAMGMWDEAAAMNRRSYESAKARAARKRVPMEAGGWHALWWLEYSLLQQGRYAEAKRLLRGVSDRFHLAEMVAAFRIETGEAYVVDGGLNIGDLGLRAIADDLLAAGIVAFHHGAARQTAAALDGLRAVRTHASAPAAVGHVHSPSNDVKIVQVAELELNAVIEAAAGKAGQAIAAASRAADLEDALPYEFGPPGPVKPARELYGDLLLQHSRGAEAVAQYRKALQRYPKRALSMLGLARAFEQSGNRGAAIAAYNELAAQWAGADPELRKAVGDSLIRLKK